MITFLYEIGVGYIQFSNYTCYLLSLSIYFPLEYLGSWGDSKVKQYTKYRLWEITLQTTNA